MGTKNNPGQFDCYANAKPDEPVFIILGRDSVGGAAVRRWVQLRQEHIGADVESHREQLSDALACADAMDEYARKLGKDPLP